MALPLSLARCAVAAFLLATASTAQAFVLMTTKAHTDITASVPGYPTATIPAGTKLGTEHSITSGTDVGCINGAAIGTRLEGLQFSYSSMLLSGPGCQATGSTQGSFRVSLWTTAPIAGSLEIIADGSASYSLDVDHDGSTELTDATGTFSIPVAVGTEGTHIILSTSLSAPNGSITRQGVSIRFVPDGPVEPVGEGCGPWLTSVHDRSWIWIDFLASGAPGATAAAFAFGFADPALPLPSGACTLHTDLLSFVYVTPDPKGEASYRLNIPPWVSAFELRAQFGALFAAPPAGPPIQLSRGLHFVAPSQ